MINISGLEDVMKTPGKRRQEQEQQRDWGLEPDQVGGLSLGLERLREMDEQK